MQHRFAEPQVIRKEVARVLEIDTYPETGAVFVRYGVGAMDDKNVFHAREEHTKRIPKEEVTPEMQAAFDALTVATLAALVADGALPEGQSEAIPAVVVPEPPTEPQGTVPQPPKRAPRQAK